MVTRDAELIHRAAGIFDDVRGDAYPKARKSSHSGAQAGTSCVELATTPHGVSVRDTTNRAGFTLSIPAGAWTRFLATLR